MAGISLKNAEKTFTGGTQGLCACSLEIADGELFGLVGPSGCGKTTVLKLISGLERLTAGELYFDGMLMNDVEPKYRDVAMVFENYSLDYKKTVFDNLAYGLKLRKVDKKEISMRVRNAAELLEIAHILNDKPNELSRAEIKRAELARAAVRRPKVFLLDEPLSGLDGKARMDTLLLIQRLWRELGITFVYATTSFGDVKALNARTAIMKNCFVRQAGSPSELYDAPSDMFVASYTGELPINLFNARSVKDGSVMRIVFGENSMIADIEIDERELYVGIRPEDINFIGSEDRDVQATVDVVERLGNESIVYLRVDGKDDYTVARTHGREFKSGESVNIYFDPQKLNYFDAQTERNLRFDK